MTFVFNDSIMRGNLLLLVPSFRLRDATGQTRSRRVLHLLHDEPPSICQVLRNDPGTSIGKSAESRVVQGGHMGLLEDDR